MFYLYGILSTVIFILILPFWLILGMLNPKLVIGFKAKLGLLAPLKSAGGKTICFYGVSVGEVIAMENLIRKTRFECSESNIVILTGTKTGQEIAHKKLGDIANLITYFPFDFPFCINNFIKKINPSALFVMETEIWPNYPRIFKNKNIPLYIINGRISDRTYKSYKKLSFIFAPVLKSYTNVFTQSNQDNNKLISIGANPENTKIMGNLKFDVKKPDVSDLGLKKRSQHKIIIAGSTHKGEDEIILDSFLNLKKEYPELKLIIAPRHPERNGDVFDLLKKTGLKCEKKSKLTFHHNSNFSGDLTFSPLSLAESQEEREQSTPFDDNEIMLLDTMGELGKVFSICDIAFIGGSFNKTGGHNPLEATIWHKPVISGPSVHNFKDIYSLLTNTSAAKIVEREELTSAFQTLLENNDLYQKATKDCELIFEQNKGALDFVLNIIKSV